MTVQQTWVRIELSHTVSIAGQVSDAFTEKPIAGARVVIVNGPPAFERKQQILARDPTWAQKPERWGRTASRADGIYLFTDLPPGFYRIQVTAPPPNSRYATVELESVQVWAERDVDGRVRLDPADVALSPTRIQGQVTNADTGEPIARAQVRLRGDTNTVLTNDEGRYTLLGLVVAEPALGLPSPTLVVCATGLDSLEQMVSLEAGQVREINVALQLI